MPTLPALLLGFTLGSPAPDAPGLLQPAHGCHRTWQRSARGWHRHGPDCELQEGLAERRKRKDRPQSKRDAAA